jgi:hypothetical protein
MVQHGSATSPAAALCWAFPKAGDSRYAYAMEVDLVDNIYPCWIGFYLLCVCIAFQFTDRRHNQKFAMVGVAANA